MPVLQFVVKFRGYGQEMRNIHYYESPELGPEEAEFLAQEIVDAYGTTIRTKMLPAFQLYGVTWRNVSLANQPALDAPIEGWSGSNTDEPRGASQNALLVSFKAATPAPNKARTYIPGIPAQQTDYATGWNQSTLTLAAQWGAAMLMLRPSEIAQIPSVPKMACRLDPVTGLAVEVNRLTIVTPRQVVATQRRRRMGQGA